jgi:hypothetical protein
MIIHNWKNKELSRLLMEKFGLGKENEPEELEEAAEEEEELDEGKGHPGEPLEAKDHPGECADVHPDLGHEEWASKNLEEAIFMKRITIKE